MNIYTKKLFFAILILLSLFISSCKRKEHVVDKTESFDSKVIVESTEVPDTLVFGSQREVTPSPVVDNTEEKGFTETDQNNIKDQMLALISATSIPEDMIIGSLEDISIMDDQNSSFINSIITFFDAAMKGEINEDILHPSWRMSILKLYNDNMYKINYNVRIGTIINKNGIKIANIRLISNDGRVSGSVMADNYDGKWLLSDVSVDINKLKNIYSRENLEFNPMNYSNILLN